eukprot:CAMPEP_0168619404 /NCGR_PEP_ID=MMETSP0449_2-20121227/6584_1 /TAXON_ID=1082188 /ORGANISM="Strombidium rassoulzadegani, Strain ras09" /LENGTH=44 /DNA_ID= /DNA_START= /DNA_END= /DNA_ORIENTATION=
MSEILGTSRVKRPEQQQQQQPTKDLKKEEGQISDKKEKPTERAQ